jgi:hypothetical protein
MKILKITTHWTTEEADCIFNLLGELQAMIWESYGDDITKMYQQMGDEQQKIKRNVEDTFNDEIPF